MHYCNLCDYYTSKSDKIKTHYKTKKHINKSSEALVESSKTPIQEALELNLAIDEQLSMLLDESPTVMITLDVNTGILFSSTILRIEIDDNCLSVLLFNTSGTLLTTKSLVFAKLGGDPAVDDLI